MLNRDSLFDAIGEIREEYISSAGQLLGYPEEENMMNFENYRRKAALRKAGRIFLIAAVLTCLLTATAYAAGLFSFEARIPDADETFRISWTENEGGYLEWKDAKLALTFPDTPESREVEFRLGWLPFDVMENMPGCHPWEALSMDTWFTRFASESLFWPENRDRLPERYHDKRYESMGQAVLIETYAMSMFNDGGAMLMLYQTPGEITEEHWDNLDVLRFSATQHLDAVPEYNVPERDYVFNFILLSNPEEGWVVEICGQDDMEILQKIAENMEFRTTGKILTQEDFPNKYLFIDVGQG